MISKLVMLESGREMMVAVGRPRERRENDDLDADGNRPTPSPQYTPPPRLKIFAGVNIFVGVVDIGAGVG